MRKIGAVGKGYAGDEAARILRERGITSALLDIYERFFTGEDGRVYGHIIDPETGHPE